MSSMMNGVMPLHSGLGQADAPMRASVLHVAGVITDGVFGFLLPAMRSLHESGFTQALVYLDEPRSRHLLMQLPPSVALHPIALLPRSRQHWAWMREEVRRLCGIQSYSICHVHGFLPWALGTRLGSAIGLNTQVIYSPHGSRSLRVLPWIHSLTKRLHAAPVALTPAVMAAHGFEATHAQWHGAQPLVEIDVALEDILFQTPRRESRRPLLIGGTAEGHHRALEMFCQLAVLLSASELSLAFNWMGHVNLAVQTRLRAANVGALPLDSEQATWQRLVPGWIYLATDHAREFPILLAQAMALGLPCVALDCPRHRDLIEHGETGMLFTTTEEAMAWIGELMDLEEMRITIGRQARDMAQTRWSRMHFDEAIAKAYRRA